MFVSKKFYEDINDELLDELPALYDRWVYFVTVLCPVHISVGRTVGTVRLAGRKRFTPTELIGSVGTLFLYVAISFCSVNQ